MLTIKVLGKGCPNCQKVEAHTKEALDWIRPAGEVELSEGVIVALRHIHISDEQAAERGLQSGDLVKVRVGGPRAITFEEVHIRTNPSFDLSLHLDTDEGNAAWVAGPDAVGEIIK